MPKKVFLLGLIILLAVVIIYKGRNIQQTIFPASENTGFKGLVFSSKNDEKRMKALDICIRNFVPSGWQSFSDYQEIGNFYEASWSNGEQIGTPNTSKIKEETYKIRLFTTEYKLPDVSGVGLEVNFTPAQTGWGFDFSFVNNVHPSITNDRFQINFNKFDDTKGTETEKVHMGSGNSYKIYNTEISVNYPTSLKDDLIGYTSSAQDMRERSLKQLEDLRQDVVAKINYDTIKHCLATQSQGSLPPLCIKEDVLNEKEKSDELKNAEGFFNSQKNLINANYQTMYDVLIKALPPKSCLFEGL